MQAGYQSWLDFADQVDVRRWLTTSSDYREEVRTMFALPRESVQRRSQRVWPDVRANSMRAATVRALLMKIPNANLWNETALCFHTHSRIAGHRVSSSMLVMEEPGRVRMWCDVSLCTFNKRRKHHSLSPTLRSEFTAYLSSQRLELRTTEWPNKAHARAHMGADRFVYDLGEAIELCERWKREVAAMVRRATKASV